MGSQVDDINKTIQSVLKNMVDYNNDSRVSDRACFSLILTGAGAHALVNVVEYANRLQSETTLNAAGAANSNASDDCSITSNCITGPSMPLFVCSSVPYDSRMTLLLIDQLNHNTRVKMVSATATRQLAQASFHQGLAILEGTRLPQGDDTAAADTSGSPSALSPLQGCSLDGSCTGVSPLGMRLRYYGIALSAAVQTGRVRRGCDQVHLAAWGMTSGPGEAIVRCTEYQLSLPSPTDIFRHQEGRRLLGLADAEASKDPLYAEFVKFQDELAKSYEGIALTIPSAVVLAVRRIHDLLISLVLLLSVHDCIKDAGSAPYYQSNDGLIGSLKSLHFLNSLTVSQREYCFTEKFCRQGSILDCAFLFSNAWHNRRVAADGSLNLSNVYRPLIADTERALLEALLEGKARGDAFATVPLFVLLNRHGQIRSNIEPFSLENYDLTTDERKTIHVLVPVSCGLTFLSHYYNFRSQVDSFVRALRGFLQPSSDTKSCRSKMSNRHEYNAVLTFELSVLTLCCWPQGHSLLRARQGMLFGRSQSMSTSSASCAFCCQSSISSGPSSIKEPAGDQGTEARVAALQRIISFLNGMKERVAITATGDVKDKCDLFKNHYVFFPCRHPPEGPCDNTNKFHRAAHGPQNERATALIKDTVGRSDEGNNTVGGAIGKTLFVVEGQGYKYYYFD